MFEVSVQILPQDESSAEGCVVMTENEIEWRLRVPETDDRILDGDFRL